MTGRKAFKNNSKLGLDWKRKSVGLALVIVMNIGALVILWLHYINLVSDVVAYPLFGICLCVDSVAVVYLSWKMRCWLSRFHEIYNITQDETVLTYTEKQMMEYLFLLVKDAVLSSRDNAYYHLLQKQAELGVMQNQINPHFLYNTLECIRGLALEQNAFETADMAELLSKLFRYYISSGDDMQPIEQELISIDNYIRIQQYRFRNRFELIKLVDFANRSIMDYKIPKLTLQPIIENIIRHAFNSKQSDNRITVEISNTQDRLVIRIADNGDGMSEEKLRQLNICFSSPLSDANAMPDPGHTGTGIALSNVNTRIRMIFGRQYGLTAFSSIGLGTQIQIDLPFEENSHG